MLERGFDSLITEAEALRLLLEGIRPLESVEELPLETASGRVLACGPRAPRDVPHYDRSAMDGFAVRAADTAGASPAGPIRFRLSTEVASLQAVPVHTGSALPAGADAVLPLEDAERDGGRIDVLRRVRVGEHVGRRGEDVAEGTRVLTAGRPLRPPDLALLRSLGIERVEAFRRPRVRIVPTGEELVGPGVDPAPGRMVDSNGIMLAAATARWGGEPHVEALYTDRPAEIARALVEASAESDLIVTCGGTSVGERDQVVEALAAAGTLTFHGVAIQPARPIAAGRVRDVPVLCFPGFPAASYIAAFVFLHPALARLAHAPSPIPGRRHGTLTRKIVSTLGLRSYTRVRLEGNHVDPLRTSGAGVLSSIARADGFVVTPENSEGAPAGAEVDVLLLD